MADEIKVTNPSANQILVYDPVEQAFVNVEPSLSIFGNTTFITGGMNLGASDGEHVFNNTVANTMRFRRIRGSDGIVVEGSGSYIDISFDGDAETLGGLARSGFLEKSNNLSDIDATMARNNINVYSTEEVDSKFLLANATNLPDVDAVYDLGSNGRRYADIYAVTFHGTATESIVAQTLKQNGAMDGQVLTWINGEGWVPRNSDSNLLSELADVDLDNLQHESVLVYNGIRNLWESAPLSSLGIIGDGTGGAGSITDAENVGNGVGTFFARFGGNLQFRSVSGGANVTVATNFNNEEIVISADVPQTTDDLTEGNNNKYFTTQRVRDALATVSIQDLGSMDAGAPVSGEAPVWNGTEWIFTPVATNLNSTDDLSEGTTNLYYRQDRVFTDIGEYLVDVNYGISLSELNDVDASQNSGTFLYSDGTRWINKAIQLSDVADISLTGLSNGSTLVYNSTNSRFEVGQFPQNLIDLGETPDSLHYNQASFDSFFSAKTTDDITETSQNRFLNNTNLVNELQTISINELVDVDTTGVSDSNVLVWSSAQSAFVPADSSSLNVSVNMGLEDLNNVDEASVINATDGQILIFNETTGNFEVSDNTMSILELSDVNASSIESGQVLTYQSGTFVARNLLPYDDVNLPVDGSILQYDTNAGAFVATQGGSLGAETLGELNDVTVVDIANNDLIVYDGALSQYVNKSPAEAFSILDLGQVNASGIVDGQALVFNGTEFVAENTLPHNLTSPANGDILRFNISTGQFENTTFDQIEVTGIQISGGQEDQVLKYDTASGTFTNQFLSIGELSNITDYSAADQSVNVLVWNGSTSSYEVSSTEAVLTLTKLSDVSEVALEEGSGVFYNSGTGLYEIKKGSIANLDDVNVSSITAGQTIVWDDITEKFESGIPVMTLGELSDVSAQSPTLNDTISWNGSEFVYSKKLPSYLDIVRTGNAYEFWDFDSLTGLINQSELIADAGYSVENGIGVYGSNALMSGVTYDTVSQPANNKLQSDVGTFNESEVNDLSMDFWYKPSDQVNFGTGSVEYNIAELEIDATNIVSERIEVRLVQTESGHAIKVFKNGTLSQTYPVSIKSGMFNHVAIGYEKSGTTTIIECYVNSVQQISESFNVVIASDLTYDVRIRALNELGTGSEPYYLDKVALYLETQTVDTITQKYNAVVLNGDTYQSINISDVDGIELTNTQIGDILIYNGTSFANQPFDFGTIDIGDLGDVDTTSVSDGDVLIYNSSNGTFEPGTIQSGSQNLGGLTDVTLTNSATDEVLTFNGTEWVNSTIDYSNIANAPVVPSSIGDLVDVDETVAPSDNQVLTFNSSTSKYEPRDPSGVSQGTSVYEFTATSGQTDFALQHDNETLVFANGFLLPSSEVDDQTSTSVVSLTTPRNQGDNIRILVIHDPAETQTNPQASVTNGVANEFTMTQGQTVISFNHSGVVMVYANGILLPSSEVDATDPTQITLNTARNANDIIRIVDFVQV